MEIRGRFMNEITNGAARLWTPEFLSMSGSNFLLFISQYIMIAALPIYIMDSLGGGELEAGMAMTFFQIGTVTARPLAGRLIDGIDKRRLLRIVAVLFIVIMGAFLVLPGLMGIYGLRLAHGALFAVATTAAAALAVLVLPPERKGTGIGYFALSTNLAMVVGPMLGLLIIGGLGARVMFAFLTACAVLAAVLLLWRKLPDEIMQPSRRRRKGLSLRDFFERRSVPAAFLGGLVFFVYGGVLTFLPLYARSLGMQEETSLFYAVFAAVIVVSRPLIGRMFDRFGPDATVWPGFVAFGLGMVLLGSVESLVGLFVAAAVLGLGFGALSPAFQTLAVTSAPPARSGVATATYFWSLDISVGLAAVLLGFVATACGYSFLYGIVLPAVIVGNAICYFFWRKTARVGRRRK